MGQKVHPFGFRLGVIRESKSRWFAEGKQYRDYLIEDMRMRNYIKSNLRDASISDIVMERAADTVTITIQTAKPGIVIGRAGQDVDRLRRRLEAMSSLKVRVNVEETQEPDLNAQLIAENIARQIERRVAYRRAMRQAVERAMRMGAEGVRCMVSGRLGGAEIARTESAGPEGRVPLQTLRADVEYGFAEARTGYGHIGCKVWVYRGEILPHKRVSQQEQVPPATEEAVEETVAEVQSAAEPVAVEQVETPVAAEAVEVAAQEPAPATPTPAASEPTAEAEEAGSAADAETAADEEDPLVAALQGDEVTEQADEESSDADS